MFVKLFVYPSHQMPAAAFKAFSHSTSLPPGLSMTSFVSPEGVLKKDQEGVLTGSSHVGVKSRSYTGGGGNTRSPLQKINIFLEDWEKGGG